MFFVPCANGGSGEWVLFDGELHVITHYVTNGNNYTASDRFLQLVMHGGIGLTTGDRYQANGVTQSWVKGSLQNDQWQWSWVENIRFIGPGPDNNFVRHYLIHATLNANGELTADVYDFSENCQ
jgi:hypothetical protein